MKSKLRTLLLQALLEDWSGSTRAKETWYSPSGQVAKLQTLRRDRLDGLDDEVVSEPLGGAHRDPDQTADQLRVVIRKQLHALDSLATEELLRERDKRLRSFGRFKDES